MQKITPCLWFDGWAEEAANFYVSVFKNSRILGLNRYGEGTLMAMKKLDVAALQRAYDGR